MMYMTLIHGIELETYHLCNNILINMDVSTETLVVCFV